MADELIHRQVDEIVEGEEFEEGNFECLCDELYAKMAEEPGGMPEPEFYGVGNIPICDPCKAERAG